MPFRRVDLANNRTTDVPVPEDLFITAEGVKMLLNVFEKEGCTILDFDVHGNYVESGTAIAAFVTRQASKQRVPVRRLSLSHNRLDVPGIVKIIIAIVTAKT